MGGAPWAKRPLGGSAGRAHRKIYIFLSNRKEKEKLWREKNGEALWPAGPGPFRREKKNDGTPDAIMQRKGDK